MVPQEIRLSSNRTTLFLTYDEGVYALSSEYLRVFSPSAEVRGHGKGQEKLQTGKRNVMIQKLELAGNYALKIIFDDGHDSGLYDWQYLQELAYHQEKNWQHYLNRLHEAKASRDESVPCVSKIKKCSH